MSDVVLDASALIAMLRGEPGADYVAERLNGALISSVNYSEVVAHYARLDNAADEIQAMLEALPLVLVPVDRALAFEAGMMRKLGETAGLSLGDRFCLALAKSQGCPAVTADKAWLRVAEAVNVRVELLR
ncbi:hypothetical protein GCM10011390_49650 [Aureimonas endophytica]|uniref:Ribonuclease VapC n=1 Tax=Aureimonas endophytica TaxID=2027858 RepID=A0A917ECX5_9HYPH|nr:type II toxin-antitoxin system VapC family toxin [Aureimonas endophytica]GGE24311.1 hypothetical protein GCM10011390_49650 [Aureimonas endophytica]